MIILKSFIAIHISALHIVLFAFSDLEHKFDWMCPAMPRGYFLKTLILSWNRNHLMYSENFKYSPSLEEVTFNIKSQSPDESKNFDWKVKWHDIFKQIDKVSLLLSVLHTSDFPGVSKVVKSRNFIICLNRVSPKLRKYSCKFLD